MTKSPTSWIPDDSGTATDGNAGDFLLLETGDKLLLETGDKLLLEDTVITEKEPIVWAEN